MNSRKAAELLILHERFIRKQRQYDTADAIKMAIPLLEAAARIEEEAHRILKRWKGVLVK